MENRVGIVTGVSRLKGIGRAICREMATKGCDIFFTYWSKYDNDMPWGIAADEPLQIQEEIKALGVRCVMLELDLTAQGAITKLLDTVNSKMGPPSILINNATYSTSSSVTSLDEELLDNHYALNIKATTLLTTAFIKNFKHEKHGRIINLTSGQSLGPMPNEIAYAMSKAAIEMLTTTLASEIAAKGITINAVNPGPNDTGWMDDQLKEELIKRSPIGRIGTPADAAKLVGYLISKDAEWITGQIIHSEGGFKRQM